MDTTPATILVVDDDVSNRQSLCWLLRHAGHHILEAASAKEALQLAASQPDLVVLDVSLPDMNGFEVGRRFRALEPTRHSPILHLSAVYVGPGDRSQALEEGADAYLIKPVEPRELLAQVQALLRIRAAEQASRLAAHEWRTTFDAIRDGVCLLDPAGQILRCNRALAVLIGLDVSSIVGRPLDDILQQGLSLETKPTLFPQARFSERLSQEIPLGPRWFHVTADPILDEKGIWRGSVLTLQDVTLRVQLEKQLRQAQRLEATGRLAAGIAHDFNNLLTAVIGNAGLLLRELPESGQEHALAGTIERAAWRAADLTRQLLGFSRKALLWMQRIDPGAVLITAAETIRPRLPENVTMEVSMGDDLWSIHADPGHLQGVLMHLFGNAFDAMPNGGKLHLGVANSTLEEGHVRENLEARTGSFVRFRVEDTGVGIAPEVVEKIFDPFFTTKDFGQGTGLGLAMVHGVAKQHQGWIECHSVVGQGTCFELFLPRAEDESFSRDHDSTTRDVEHLIGR